MKNLLFGLGIGVLLTGVFFVKLKSGQPVIEIKKEIVDEESVVIKVVEKATPSVVTVSVSKTSILFNGLQEQDIGTGFVISSDGLIVTNKHVVSDMMAKYKVVIGKDKVVEVKNIYRDPSNDLAILKVDIDSLVPVALGDSDKVKVGQTVIAIGTALGEFRSTVTKGVISGLGRGITAGSLVQGSEKLENVIQTDAAINPGNSGGPLLNSSGEVIGVNVAVSQSAQNIGFALPINLVKTSINNFKTTGEFDRPYFGVTYQWVPAGAYIREVIVGSPAEKAGIKTGDILIEIDDKKLTDDKVLPLANYINTKKIGDSISIKLYRDNQEVNLNAKLEKKN